MGCESCDFLCSDERYLLAHMSIEHQQHDDSEDNDQLVNAVKDQIKKGNRKKSEIEAAITATSKTLQHLYAALMINSTPSNVDEAEKIMDQVNAADQPTSTTNETSPVRSMTPEAPRSAACQPVLARLNNLISPNSAEPMSELNRAASRKRKMSVEDESTSLNLSDEPSSHGTVGATVFPGLSRFPSTNLGGMIDTQAILETIKRVRLRARSDRVDEDDEEEQVVVQPREPGETTTPATTPAQLPKPNGPTSSSHESNKTESEDEIIEIPIDEADYANGLLQNSTFSNPNPALHQLLNQQPNQNTTNSVTARYL